MKSGNWIMVDVEADGPIPGDFSMVSFGAVHVSSGATFFATLKPISNTYHDDALAVSGYTREETLQFPDPMRQMWRFRDWLNAYQRPMFISDNNGFDWQFINWYLWHFAGENPFGFSSTNLGSLYKGCVGSMFENFKHLRGTKHTHHPVDDARGNVEAFKAIIEKHQIKINL